VPSRARPAFSAFLRFLIFKLQALGLGKDDLIQALGLSFTVSSIAPCGEVGVA
jgi:hypothetical protein